jgi:hypothetical protein
MQSTTTPRSYAEIEADARRMRAEVFRDMIASLRSAFVGLFAAKGHGKAA